MDTGTRRQALIKYFTEAKFLEDVLPSKEDTNAFYTASGKKILVLTIEEANAEAEKYVEDYLCYLNADFLCKECGIYSEDNNPVKDKKIEASINKLKDTLLEYCNPIFKAMINDTCGMERFKKDAIEKNGRAFFIPCNGLERKVLIGDETMCIYFMA